MLKTVLTMREWGARVPDPCLPCVPALCSGADEAPPSPGLSLRDQSYVGLCGPEPTDAEDIALSRRKGWVAGTRDSGET